jgi:hypothetical protein
LASLKEPRRLEAVKWKSFFTIYFHQRPFRSCSAAYFIVRTTGCLEPRVHVVFTSHNESEETMHAHGVLLEGFRGNI